MHYVLSRRFLTTAVVFLFGVTAFPSISRPASTPPVYPSPSAAPPSAAPGAIVIGFVGGHVARGNAIHNEVQLANRLSAAANVQVRMFENRRGLEAHQEVLRLLDTDRDGTLSTEEKDRARVAIYGHSWGASEAIALARLLARDRIPVVLTVQVDSVQKLGQDDAWIPPNVRQAVNFYQLDGFLHGRPLIRAVDAAQTKILGNYQFDYKTDRVDCAGFPWYARLFMRPHIEIESDPAVWQQVETLIRSKLSLVRN